MIDIKFFSTLFALCLSLFAFSKIENKKPIYEGFLVGSGVNYNNTCEADRLPHRDYFYSSNDLSPSDYVRFNSAGMPLRKSCTEYANLVEKIEDVVNNVKHDIKKDILPSVNQMLPTKTMVDGVDAEPHTYNYCRHIFAPIKAKGYSSGDPIRGDIEILENKVCNSGWFIPHQSTDPERNLHKGAMRYIFGNRTAQV